MLCLLPVIQFVVLSACSMDKFAQNGPTEWSASPFNPSAFSLAITGWYALVSVDGQAYRISRATDVANVTTANQTAVEFTSTRTSFLFATGGMQINASFFGPVEYSEDAGIAQDAMEYYTFKKIDGTTVSWAISDDTINRATAANPAATPGNTTRLSPRPVRDSLNNWTTLGIAVGWGNVDSTLQPAVWAIGLVRTAQHLSAV
ncbi:DUF1793-domain-containing protein [Sanghuangporus baumii]|uniref:DUF1793-domain-containing protein n=1 Tax=Sanghuangporus baumii TaxID=108892 RepID=A0A9Q5I529_SANBA|nr:DUF1793-domain-containing protein [Sanghuangporus baumii]